MSLTAFRFAVSVWEVLGINTIETAFIVPMIFLITFAMFEVAFFYLDIAKVSSSISNATSYMSLSAGKTTDEVMGVYDIKARNELPLYDIDLIEDEMRLSDRIDSERDGRLLLLKPERLEVTIINGRITVDSRYKAKHPLWQRFNVDAIKYSSSLKVEVGDYADDMRKKKVLKMLKESKKDE